MFYKNLTFIIFILNFIGTFTTNNVPTTEQKELGNRKKIQRKK